MSEKEAVTVKILDREYRIGCDPGERRQLMDAADYLDQQMRQLKEGLSSPGVEKIAVLAALNMANELLASRSVEAQFTGEVSDRILNLRQKLDESLESTG